MSSNRPGGRRDLRPTVSSGPAVLVGGNLSDNRYPDLNRHPAAHPVMNRNQPTSGYPPSPAWYQARLAALQQQQIAGTRSVHPVTGAPQPNAARMIQQGQRLLQRQPRQVFGNNPVFYQDQLPAIPWLHGITMDLDDIVALREGRMTALDICMKYNPQMAMMILEQWRGYPIVQQERRQQRSIPQPRDGTAPPGSTRSGLSREMFSDGIRRPAAQPGRAQLPADALVRSSTPDRSIARRRP